MIIGDFCGNPTASNVQWGETSMKPAWEGSDTILEFECHLDIQVDSSNNVCSKWRMKIQTEQNKPHRKQMSIAQEFIVSFTIIKFYVTIVYIGK